MKKIILMALSFFTLSAQADSRFELKSSLNYLPEVIRIADCVTNLKSFQDEVGSIEKFTSSNDNGTLVVSKMMTSKKAIVRHYTKRASKVTAKTVGDEVYFNRKMNPRALTSMVNTAIHERLHVLGYHHKGNYPKKNKESVPYKVGDISEKYIQQCKEK